MSERTTQAAVLVESGRPLQVMELEVPALKPGQVLVDLAYSGVCHTQLLEARGHRGVDRFLPHTLGHEGSGVVIEVGAEVRKVAPGDRVVVSWIKGSGKEVPAAQYRAPEGTINSGAVSTFMTKAVVSENRLTRIPLAMPLREGALLGCAIPTGAGVVRNTAAMAKGSIVAIFGMGGIGSSTLLAARLTCPARIVAVDIVPSKLERAIAMGATDAIDARDGKTVEAIKAITGGAGADYVIEAAGRPESIEAAFSSTRDGGGLCIVAGNVRVGERIRIDPYDLIRGKRIVGTWGGECELDRDVPLFVDEFLKGELPLDALITHQFPLIDINRALDMVESGAVGRALIDCRS